MLFSTPGQAILIAHERHSRITIALRQSSLKADPVADALVGMLKAMPAGLRRSITFDNGTEFNRYQRIASQLGLNAYFCDPRAPWQKAASKTPSEGSAETSDRKSTRLNSSHYCASRMPSSA